MKDLKIGQKIYFFSKYKNKIEMCCGQVNSITRFDVVLRKTRFIIKTDYFTLDYSDVFTTKKDAINHLKSQIVKLESWDE